MAEIVLAEFGGNHWVVAGDEHLGDLLRNALPEGIAVRFVDCTSAEEPRQLWEQGAVRDAASEAPWLINPAIIRRIKGALGSRSITFAPWSAMLDEAATGIVDAAAEWMVAKAPVRTMVRQFASAKMPPGMVDLQRLRGQLVAQALVRAGADAGAIEQETADATDAGGIDRVELVTIEPER